MVHGNADHPGRQSGTAIELIQAGENAEHDILRGFAGIVGIGKHAATDGGDAREDATRDFFKGWAVARGRLPNEAKVFLRG